MKRGLLIMVGLSTALASNQAISAVDEFSDTLDYLDMMVQWIRAVI